MNDANKLFEAALLKVESASIRAWAQTDRNSPLWVKHCASAKGVYADPNFVAAYIVALAIGL